MTIELIVVGKTTQAEVEQLVALYGRRLTHYVRFSITYIADIRNAKNLSQAELRTAEGEQILRHITPTDRLVLLDEHGAEYRSIEFAQWLQRHLNSSLRRLVFVIGGAYGFSDAVYQRANEKISLSKMTFSHQIVRAIFAEQLYRGFSIINNEPYHHE